MSWHLSFRPTISAALLATSIGVTAGMVGDLFGWWQLPLEQLNLLDIRAAAKLPSWLYLLLYLCGSLALALLGCLRFSWWQRCIINLTPVIILALASPTLLLYGYQLQALGLIIALLLSSWLSVVFNYRSEKPAGNTLQPASTTQPEAESDEAELQSQQQNPQNQP